MVQRLERMSDGIARHKKESGYPPRLKEDERRALRKKLEDLREQWESLVQQSDRAYDNYAAHFALCGAELAKDDDSLRGYYGKTNTMLADYGTKVLVKPSGKVKAKKQPMPS
jgi:hypothetical protein